MPITNAPAKVPRRGYRTGDARRVQILDVARDLIAVRGVEAVSLRDIAVEVGISHVAVGRHFGSVELILDALVDRYERANVEWWEQLDGSHGSTGDRLVALADRNAHLAGYIAIFTALAGSATSSDHPANPRMRTRYADLRVSYGREFNLDPEGPLTVEIPAIFDGLQLQQCYQPDLGLAFHLWYHLRRTLPDTTRPTHQPRRHVAAGGFGRLSNDPRPAPKPAGNVPATSRPAGRRRRAEIIEASSRMFARTGYHATSIGDLARAVGIAKSSVIHHFGSKEALLVEVLAAHDASMEDRVRTDVADGAEPDLATIVAQARRDAVERRGLIELYTVLSAEAGAIGHPAHDYFGRRFDRVRGFYAGMLEPLADCEHPVELTPSQAAQVEATLFVALWDGLQIQWLYAPDEVDVAASLTHYIESLERASATAAHRSVAETGPTNDALTTPDASATTRQGTASIE